MLLMLAVPAVLGGKDALSLVATLSPAYIALFILLSLTKWTCMSLRWLILIGTGNHPVRKRSVFAIVLASDFASEAIPVGVGAIASNLLFFKRQGVPATATVAFANFIFILDLAAVFLVLSTALLLTFHSGNHNTIWIAMAATALVLVVMVALFLALRYIDKLALLAKRLSLHRFIPSRYKEKALELLVQLKTRYAQTGQIPLRTLLPLLLVSLVVWSIRFSLLYLAIRAVGGNLSWAYTAVAQFVSGLIGMITFLPGGFPGMDVSIAALLHGDLTMKTILAAIFLWRLVTYHINFFVGGASFSWLSAKASKSTNSEAEH